MLFYIYIVSKVLCYYFMFIIDWSLCFVMFNEIVIIIIEFVLKIVKFMCVFVFIYWLLFIEIILNKVMFVELLVYKDNYCLIVFY